MMKKKKCNGSRPWNKSAGRAHVLAVCVVVARRLERRRPSRTGDQLSVPALSSEMWLPRSPAAEEEVAVATQRQYGGSSCCQPQQYCCPSSQQFGGDGQLGATLALVTFIVFSFFLFFLLFRPGQRGKRSLPASGDESELNWARLWTFGSTVVDQFTDGNGTGRSLASVGVTGTLGLNHWSNKAPFGLFSTLLFVLRSRTIIHSSLHTTW